MVARAWGAVLVAGLLLAGPVPARAEPPTFTVNSTVDAPDSGVDGNCSSAAGQCTLRAAVTEASAKGATALVVVPAGRYPLDSPVVSTGSVTVTGAGASTVIAIGSTERGFAVSDGALALTSLWVTGGVSPSGAAAIDARDADLVLTDVTVMNAAADGDGGAVSVVDGSLRLLRTRFVGNTGQAGGAALVARSDVDIRDSAFTGNGASQGGGALMISSPSSLRVSGTTFEANTATGPGGAVVLDGYTGEEPGSYALSGDTFTSNAATGSGGALHVSSTTNGVRSLELLVSGATFKANTASVGGALAVDRARVRVRSSAFRDNRATEGGGGAVAAGGDLRSDGCTFEGNDAATSGGAVVALGGVTLEKVSFRRNHAGSLGSALAASGRPPTTSGLTLEANTSDAGSPAIWSAQRDRTTASSSGSGLARPPVLAAGAVMAVVMVGLVTLALRRRRTPG